MRLTESNILGRSTMEGLITNQPEQTLTGHLNETATLTVNGRTVSLGQDNGFQETATLREGLNAFHLAAEDRAGNTGQVTIHLALDTVAPPAVVIGLITISDVEDGQVTITGAEGSVEAGAKVMVKNLGTGETVVVVAGGDGSFTARIDARAGDSLAIVAVDGAGNESTSISVDVTATSPPAAGKIPEGSFGDMYRDLVPTNATIEQYDPRRLSLITGEVKTESGQPVTGAIIGIHGHPEYGTVTTDGSGRFTIPVDGGGNLNVTYSGEGFIRSDRQVYVPWNDIAVAETVSLVAQDTASTTITFDGSPGTVMTHRSTEVADSFGRRSCTLVFAGDSAAYEVDAQGNTLRRLDTLTVRATEFRAPESMPAKLPPTSAYTYCVELSVDGAQRARFDKPVVAWIENFIGFSVGQPVPVGYYDRDRGAWVPSDDGRVVMLLDTNGDGLVDSLDFDGDGQSDDINGDGRFDDEIRGLTQSQLHSPGASFWRVELMHFSPWDFNWPFGFPVGATAPNGEHPYIDDEQMDEPPDCTEANASFVEERSRIFHEDIRVPGTELSLHYASNRVRDYRQKIIIPVSGASVPAYLENIIVQLDIAGRRFESTLEPLPDQKITFVWDGLDHLGNLVVGGASAHVKIGFVYKATYWGAANYGGNRSFGLPGNQSTSLRAREGAILWKWNDVEIPATQNRSVAIGEG